MTEARTMLAWQAIGHGKPADALRLVATAIPEPGPGEVRLRVESASLNPIDYKLLRGDLRRVDAMRFPVTMGFDACGIVDALGEGAGQFRHGERVFVRASRATLGAFAEYTVQPENFMARAPHNVTIAGASSLPLVALTTVQALVDRADARAGQRILIHAGSGGLGSFAIQYARCLGLAVDTTTSAANAEWVGKLGADSVIAYDRDDYRKQGAVYDIVFDTLGGRHALDAFRVVKPGGCVVSVAGPPDRAMAAEVARGALQKLAMKWMSRQVYAAAAARNARYFRFLTVSDGAQLAGVAGLVEAGLIKPVLDRIYPFPEAVAAFEYLTAGRAKGKVILDLETAAVALDD